MPKRPCIDCGKLGTDTRCGECDKTRRGDYERGRVKPPHYAQRYGHQWRKFSKAVRDEFLRGAGNNPPVCPGWGTPPHLTTAQRLTVDHDLLDVLCRSCNSRKAATHDRARAREARGAG